MNFNNYPWHDAVIKNIDIDRTNPGNLDMIQFEIEWPDEKGKVLFIFEEVYWAQMNLNFGIVAEETIMDAIELEKDNLDLTNLYEKRKWNRNVIELKIFRIDLNSTGGVIKIISTSFRTVAI